MGFALCPGPRFRPILKYLSLSLAPFSFDEWQGFGSSEQRFGPPTVRLSERQASIKT